MAEDLVKILLEEAESEIVAYTDFVRDYDRHNHQKLYCFFEGSDDYKYYHSRFKSFAVDFTIDDYVCFGKENVIKVCELIKGKAEYSDAKTGFFVDTDFDPPINNVDIYETQGYSFENFYVTRSAIAQILKVEFGIKDKQDASACLDIYDGLIEEFNSAILMLNAWIACYADKRNAGTVTTRLRIDQKTKKIFYEDKIVVPDLISIKDFSDINTKEKIDELFSNTIDVTDEALTTKMSDLSTKNKTYALRGKFLLKFFVDFLIRLQSKIAHRKQEICKKEYRCNLRFEIGTLISILCTHADTPKELIDYITKIAA